MFQLTAEELAGIVAVVVGFTELIKLSKYVDERYGLLIAALTSALGIAAYASSKPELVFNRFMIWPFVSAFLVVITAAGGVYGIIRSTRGADAVDASGPRNTPRAPMWFVAVLLAPLALSAACAKANPNISPERQVALYGTQVAGYLKEVKTSADNLYAKQVLPKPAYERTLEVLLKVNEAGVQLADALAAYDAATSVAEKETIVKKIDAALAAIQVLLPQVIPLDVSNEARARLNTGITEVQRLLLTIMRFTAPQANNNMSALPVAA